MRTQVGVSRLTAPGSFIMLSEALADRFTVRRSLGYTPTSLLYLAEEAESRRPITVSVIRPEILAHVDSDRIREGFDAARRLDHPGIESVIGVEQAGDVWYSTSWYTPGWSVRDKLAAHGAAPLAQSFDILLDTLEALAHAHAHDVIHALLTPSLVILTERGLVLRGFGPGMSVWSNPTNVARPEGLVSPYAAPELRSGSGQPTAGSDLYSFGALAQELLLGQPPGTDPWTVDALSQALSARAGAGLVTSDLPPDEGVAHLASLLARCLDRDPTARPDRAESVRAELLNAVATLGIEPTAGPAAHPQEPGRIGQYRIVEKLGEGGMGVVYRAEKVGDLRRPVALKVIRMGMDTREVVGRFEREREALGILSHENVARIYDASVSEGGRPYFVMELVDGIPVTDYADSNRLTVRERLRLFERVCFGVQHAHQKGVIHRDLKPSNVIIAGDGAEATPKIIDFGLAKVVADPLVSSGETTHVGQVLGTPDYMSPEQASGRAREVDTRSDVYSLGAILYELLTGVVPTGAAMPDGEPLPPSRRVSGHPEAALLAERRGTATTSLIRELAGDLDAVVLKALAPAREGRYQTVNELADDLRRCLVHEPVMAQRPTPWYRTRKFVRRHRAAVATAFLVSGVVVGGLAATTVLWLRATQAEAAAAVDAETSDRVVEFMAGLFEQADPYHEGDPTLAEVLEVGAQQLESGLEEQPLVRARIQGTIGRAYSGLGLLDEAEAAYRDQAAILRESAGESDPEYTQALLNVGGSVLSLGRFDEADSILSETLALLQTTEPEPADSAVLGRALRTLAYLKFVTSDLGAADSLYQQAIAVQRAHLGPRHIDVGRTLSAWGRVLANSGRVPEAVDPILSALDIIEASAIPRRAAYLFAAQRTATDVFMRLGDWERGEQYGRQALATLEVEVGPDHPDVARVALALGQGFRAQGRLDEAAQMLERSASILERRAPGHGDTGAALSSLGLVYMSLERYAEARGFLERALPVLEATFGSVHANVAVHLRTMAMLEIREGRFTEAEALLGRSLEIWTEVDGPNRLGVGDATSVMASLYTSMGRLDEAEAALWVVLEIVEEALPPEHPAKAEVVQELANTLRALGREEEAREVEAKIGGS